MAKVNHLKLETLITNVGNCSFDCGAYDDVDGNEDGISYEKLVDRSRQAKKELMDYVFELAEGEEK